MLDTELRSGSEFAGYRIEHLIGQGGMGSVFLCTEVLLDRPVALKVIAPSLARDEVFRRRFAREAQIAAQIDHPHVVPVYAAGEHAGHVFIAMRYVEGPDLGDVIRQAGRLAPEDALTILDQIAGALDAAHARSLIHRDVKPSNILLAELDHRWHAYLSDFGLSREVSVSSDITRSGQAIGTLAYMAPEQIRGDQVDTRTDVYALGCVLYECLTGTAPFSDRQGMRVLWAHLQEPPPRASDVVHELDPALDHVLERALAKEPGDRFPTAGALAKAARAAFEGDLATDVQRTRLRPSPVGPIPSARSFAPDVPAVPPPQAAPADATEIGRPPAAPSRWTQRQLPSPEHTRPHNPVAGGTARSRIPLGPGFRYLHEPLRSDSPIPLLGNEQIIGDLTNRLARSDGGSFLVTGFRGVGKTTVVERVIAGVTAAVAPTRVLAVRLNVARPRTTSELLYEIIRRLYDEVEQTGVVDTLDAPLRERLSIAYRRTSLSYTEKRGDAVERARGLALGLPLMGIAQARLNGSTKTTSSLATEASYLPYSDAEVEQDFEQIIRLLERDAPAGKRGLLARILRRAPQRRTRCQLLVVVDELDKLTTDEDGRRSIEELVASLKSLLTTRGAHFLFVAGPDLHEQALQERQRGNSVYDAVFGWQVYVPCVWQSEDELLDALIADPEVRRSEDVDALRDYLAFWGRGVPRLLVGALQGLVSWDDDGPSVRLDGPTLEMIRAYATLEQVIREFIEPRARGQERGIESDKWRLGVYYAVEWILRYQVTFGAADVASLADCDESSIDPLLGLEEPEVEELLDHLAERRIVHQVSGRLADHTFYGGEPAAHVAAYEVCPDIVARLRGVEPIESRSGVVGIGAGDVPAHVEPAVFRGAVGQAMDGGRYHLLDEINRTGNGRVYRARDRDTDSDVAIKVFDIPAVAHSDAMLARFEREERVAVTIDHPNIVRTHRTFREADGRHAIVMELVAGRSLGDRISGVGPLVPRRAIAVADGVLDALEYLDDRGIARLDMRPSSVILRDGLSPKLVNLGLAKPVRGDLDVATPTGSLVGTPAYCAPEQLRDVAVDIRTDMYALALILYEAIRGEPARSGESVTEVLQQVLFGRVDLDALQVSRDLRDVIDRATAREPADRYASPAAMRAALAATPEAVAA